MLKTLFAPRKPVEQVLISDDERIPVDGFVQMYLLSRNYSPNPANQKMVADKLAAFRGSPCVDRSSLEAFLDKGWVK